ncbi:MAG: response regulator [Clostridia bacterium]
MKALLVDDDRLVCAGLQKLVPWAFFGFDEVLEAYDGQQAYALAMSQNPDLIISDISMPVMDGLSFCEKISQNMVDVPVILLSAYDNFEYARTAMRFGVAYYLLKPIDKPKIEELKAVIQEIMKHKTSKTASIGLLGGEAQQAVLKALKACDSASIRDFFEHRLRGSGIGLSDQKGMYAVLINLLYSYLDAENITRQYVTIDRQAALNVLSQTQSMHKLECFVEGLYLEVLQTACERKNNPDEQTIRKIKEYVHAHYANEELSVASLAQELKISASYLGTVFKNSEHVNLSAYITEYRIEKACELLKKPFAKVADAALLVGYHDPLYFTKVFKKCKGITPSEYQAMHM